MLDRNAVEDRFRRHIRSMKDAGTRVTDDMKRQVRKLHEQMARKAEERAKRKP